MKTKIEWTDWTCNCFWGCENGCPYCQARNMARRFGERIGIKRAAEAPRIYTPEVIQRMKEFKPVFLPDQLAWLYSIKKPSRVFISFMGDWAADWHSGKDRELMFGIIKSLQQHTFLLLTKQPQNLAKWSPFPENCWVGVTATDSLGARVGISYLRDISATVRFASLEPLLGGLSSKALRLISYLDWLIVGRQTPISKKTEPKIEWIQEIVEAGDKAGIPVFLKENLKPLLLTRLTENRYWADHRDTNGFEPLHTELRREFPIKRGGE